MEVETGIPHTRAVRSFYHLACPATQLGAPPLFMAASISSTVIKINKTRPVALGIPLEMKLLLFILLTLCPCIASTVPVPRIMQVRVGGYSGAIYEVIFDRHSLRYFKADNMHDFGKSVAKEILVTDEQWSALLSSFDRLQVWSWKRNYINPAIADGAAWSCVIVYDTMKERAVVCYGSNDFPKGYDDFIAAIGDLIGDPKFGKP